MSGKSFRILHLSDLHFGANFHWSDLRSDAKACASTLVEYVEAGLAAGGLNENSAQHPDGAPYFDLLAISGDLTNFGRADGFTAAVGFVDLIRGRQPRWWAAGDILLIPGNHDLEFGPKPANHEPGPRMLLNMPREERQKPYREAYKSICQKENGASDWLAVLKIFDEHRLTIVGLDSCRLESWQSPGMGYVGLDQVSLLISQADLHEIHSDRGGLNGNLPWVRLAFVHHHPQGLEGQQIEMSGLVSKKYGTFTFDANYIQRELCKERIDFVLHGHLHKPDRYQDENQTRGFAKVLGVGSIGVAAAQCWGPHHFYTLEISPPENGAARSLKVRSFEHTTEGVDTGFWKVAEPDVHTLLSANAEPANPHSPEDLLDRSADAPYWESFCEAFEEWPRAQLLLTVPDSGMWLDLLPKISTECEAIWRRLKKTDPTLPEWPRAMTLLLRIVGDKGQLMLRQYEQFLNGDEARRLPPFLIHYLLVDEYRELDKLRRL